MKHETPIRHFRNCGLRPPMAFRLLRSTLASLSLPRTSLAWLVSGCMIALVGCDRPTTAPQPVFGISIAPRDTLVNIGESYTLSANAFDRFANPVAGDVAFQIIRGPAELGSDGRTVRTTDFGQVIIEARVESVVDTVYARVVPAGTISGYARNADGVIALYTVGVDQRDLREWVVSPTPESYNVHMPSSWSADGQSIIYQLPWADGQTEVHARSYGAGGSVHLAGRMGDMASAAFPQAARDSDWIYFNAVVVDGFGGLHTTYRIRLDGTGLEHIELPSEHPRSGYPSPSPDGARLAFVTGDHSHNAGLRIMTLATGEIVSVDVPAILPRWSPRGEMIAFIEPSVPMLDLGHAGYAAPGKLWVGTNRFGFQSQGWKTSIWMGERIDLV
jgi:hypothetical protein